MIISGLVSNFKTREKKFYLQKQNILKPFQSTWNNMLINIIAHIVFDRLESNKTPARIYLNYRWLIMQSLSSIFSIESNKPLIAQGDGGYRFSQSRQDNIHSGLRPRPILLVSNKS